MGVWVEKNLNPYERRVGDCAVRAVAAALDTDWDDAYLRISVKGFTFKNVISSDAIWGAVLRDNGFRRAVIPNECPECYTAEDFCLDHPTGTYVLGFGGHTATVKDGGRLIDTWDSSGEVPIYYWYKPEESEDDYNAKLQLLSDILYSGLSGPLHRELRQLATAGGTTRTAERSAESTTGVSAELSDESE